MEWRKVNHSLCRSMPSVSGLEHESNNIIASIAADIDKHQLESTLRIRQRACDLNSYHVIAKKYSEMVKDELQLLAQCKTRLRKAIENVNIVDGINRECREIRKNRLTEDLVRDTVEEELFQESGLCQEIQLLYKSVLTEYEATFSTLKKANTEIQSLWGDQKEAITLETENIGLNNRSPHISYCHGIARLDPDMSTVDLWEKYTKETLENVKMVLENSRSFRKKISSPVIEDSVKDLVVQADKVVKAFLKRNEETQNALTRMECELQRILKEIAHCEQLYVDLETLGRQIDYNLKVVQTRLDNRRRRPGPENCRDPAQYGLMTEIKTVCDRVSAIQQQIYKLQETITKLYSLRKELERQIQVKKHTLSIDSERCMNFRKQFPHPCLLLGF
ncbi:UNVERIFIED_CONTAM: hypothetical protein PYX00_007406 [Menopon gallinae]